MSNNSVIPEELKDNQPRKKSPIYTRTGDSGTSSLYSGDRRAKFDEIFEVLGTLDELNASLGVARQHCQNSPSGIGYILSEVQSRLFDLGAVVATPASSASQSKLSRVTVSAFSGSEISTYQFDVNQQIIQLEAWIDRMDVQLKKLETFILPSGGLLGAHLHLARAVCRRAERRMVELSWDAKLNSLQTNDDDMKQICRYLNRLSDFLFVAARYAAMKVGEEETKWSPVNKPKSD